MKNIKSLRFKSSRAGEIDLINDEAIILANISGVSAETNVNLQSVAGQDGAVFQSAAVPQRYITVGFHILQWQDIQVQQCRMYRLFAPGSRGTMYYRGRIGGSKIDYIVEKCVITPEQPRGTLSLVCPDPFFRGEESKRIVASEIVSGFRFPFTFPAGSFYISSTRRDAYTEVYNDGDVNTGMTVTLEATGTVVDPYIENAATGERSTVRITMERGDKLVITTGREQKSATLYRGGRAADVFNSLVFPFVFHELAPGVNTFAFGAPTGWSRLLVSYEFSPKYGAMVTNAPYEDEFPISVAELSLGLDKVAETIKKGGFYG